MGLAIVFLFLATFLSTSHAKSDVFSPIHLLRQRSGAGDQPLNEKGCRSWHLAVETNNLQGWKTVPHSCVGYVATYMIGLQYSNDVKTVVDAAIEYAKGVKLAGDGKDVWVFDISETALSNLPYYARPDVQFGAKPYNRTKFNEWLLEGIAPPVPGVLRLYETVLSLGFKTVFLSGTSESLRDIRAANLQNAGYYDWEKLILKGEDDRGVPSMVYKSKKRTELVNEGYRILGNIGDQWSDLSGENAGKRTFKVPNPMYYV